MASRRVALVTGATGFVGSRLVRRLLQDGVEVRVLTSGTERSRVRDIEGRIQWFDWTTDHIVRAADGVQQFFNFAVAYDRPGLTTEYIEDVNVAGPLRVIDALQKNQSSVTCVMGDSFFRKFPDQATAQPRYTRSKAMLARQLSERQDKGTSQFALLMIEQLYGPGDSLQKVLPRVVQQMLSGQERIPLTLGNQRRDFIHVDDVVEAALLTANLGRVGLIEVGCGCGRSTPVAWVFKRLKDITGSRTHLDFGAMPADQFIGESVADTSWLRSQGWSCRVPLEDGLMQLVTDVATRGGRQWSQP